MSGKRILVACPDLDYLLINKVLSESYCLDKAKSAADVIAHVEHEHYDLLLLDIALINSESWIMEQLKEKKCPVIALSSEMTDTSWNSRAEKGYSACYVKPIRQREFQSMIHHWITKN